MYVYIFNLDVKARWSTHSRITLSIKWPLWLLPDVGATFKLIAYPPDTHGLHLRPFSHIDDPYHISHAAHPSRSSSRQFTLSVFLPLRPTGPVRLWDTSDWPEYQQTFTVSAPELGTLRDSSSTGSPVVEVVCICVSFLLWRILLTVKSRVFKVSFWGLVFPNVTIFFKS